MLYSKAICIIRSSVVISLTVSNTCPYYHYGIRGKERGPSFSVRSDWFRPIWPTNDQNVEWWMVWMVTCCFCLSDHNLCIIPDPDLLYRTSLISLFVICSQDMRTRTSFQSAIYRHQAQALHSPHSPLRHFHLLVYGIYRYYIYIYIYIIYLSQYDRPLLFFLLAFICIFSCAIRTHT